MHWFRKIKTKKEITFTTCNFTICYKVTYYLTTHLFDWLIVGLLTSSGKYVINIQDENIFNILCKSFLLFAYYIYSHWRYTYQKGGGWYYNNQFIPRHIVCLFLVWTWISNVIILSSVTNATCCLTSILFDWLIAGFFMSGGK